jgi:threonine dehydratase
VTRQRTSFTRVILGTLLVLAGLAAALVTVLARRSDNVTLAGVAAILGRKLPLHDGERVVAVVSGGNIDLDKLKQLL